MHSPLLNFFQNLFKISKLEYVNSPFFLTPSINYWGIIFQGKIAGRNFGGSYPGCSCSGRNYSGKNVRGQTYRGNSLEGLSWELIVQGCNCPWEKLFSGNYPEGKSPEGNFLGRNFIGGSYPLVSCQGEISRCNFPGENSGGQLPWGNFMRSNCLGGSCPGGNIP